ncbi:hypothetical protein AGRA3207_007370 [Actinomadura graeca]|uniref:PIN domain-containing protein n=1 Tax=Actinomadura graeca TaxID=2750812 RepID=A0ABX8R440_9ACTN|nr:PIN domain-containing protein [Actinomadura graeca]QXJ25815.1 hypothetical protein AGRA3207_007370 [Actinomadura graeca]
MHLRLLPGATPDSIFKPLERVRNALENLGSQHYSAAVGRRNDYLRWVNTSVAALRHVLPPGELDRLLMTPAYWHIHAIDAVDLAVNTDTINNEIDFRKTELRQIEETLQAQRDRWAAARVVVPDTSMFCRHAVKLAEWDLAEHLRMAEGEPLHIAVPLVVVEELDRLKESGRKHTRWRAGHATGVLNGKLPRPQEPGILREAGFKPGRGAITLEILMDRPGHVRLPIEDAEIVDQAFAVQGLAAHPVTVATYDTGQTMEARSRGLQVLNLHLAPTEPEPPQE